MKLKVMNQSILYQAEEQRKNSTRLGKKILINKKDKIIIIISYKYKRLRKIFECYYFSYKKEITNYYNQKTE